MPRLETVCPAGVIGYGRHGFDARGCILAVPDRPVFSNPCRPAGQTVPGPCRSRPSGWKHVVADSGAAPAFADSCQAQRDGIGTLRLRRRPQRHAASIESKGRGRRFGRIETGFLQNVGNSLKVGNPFVRQIRSGQLVRCTPRDVGPPPPTPRVAAIWAMPRSPSTWVSPFLFGLVAVRDWGARPASRRRRGLLVCAWLFPRRGLADTITNPAAGAGRTEQGFTRWTR